MNASLKSETDFNALGKSLKAGPDWLNTLRQNGLAAFEASGIPSNKNEDWKYTNLKSFAGLNFQASSQGSQDFENILGESDQVLAFIDGHFSPEHSKIKTIKGLTLLSLAEAIEKGDADLRKTLENSQAQSAFADLNKGLLQEGVFIKVKKDTKIEGTIQIAHLFTEESDEKVAAPRNVILLEAGARAEIVESISAKGCPAYFLNTVTDISLSEKAHLDYLTILKNSNEAYYFGQLNLNQEKESFFEAATFTLSGKLTRCNAEVSLNGENIYSGLNCFYHGKDKMHIDNHTLYIHAQPECDSSQLFKGILDDKARAVFTGRIIVKEIAQKTNAYQLNRNLMLSPGAHADARPQLEIFADDVKCTHGATIGQLEEEELFYLLSRGVSPDDATAMLIEAYAVDILEKIQNENLRGKVKGLLDSNFGSSTLDA